MSNQLVDRLFELIKDRYPVYFPAIQRTKQMNPELFNSLSSLASEWAFRAFGEEVLSLIADGYAHFVSDVTREQMAYDKRGSYRNKSYNEVFKSVYDNDDYMRFYHWGVFGTTFLWSHHLNIYGFFRDRFVSKYLNDDCRLIDLGCGSGIWSILAARYKSSIHIAGYDISKSSLEVSQLLAKHAGVDERINFFVGDAISLASNSLYNAGISAFLLEHLEDPMQLVKSFDRNLEPGSPLFITAAVTAAEIDHIFEFRTEGEVVELLETNGFRVLELFSATPKPDLRMRFLPRSVAIIAQKKVSDLW
jgi:2-polyprenyl-3-methyl-5-hydroxy-6-metoxy-1,4-benzoquinol methylase